MTTPESNADVVDDSAEAFGHRLWAHRRDVHKYLARRSFNDADDLLVDVWVTAYQSRHTYDPTVATERLWLFGIARNVLRGHFKKTSRESLVQRLRIAHDSEDWAAVDNRLDAARVSADLRAQLAKLRAADREVLLLVAWEDLSPAEAAVVLGIPQGTARSRLHRARRELRRSLSERLPPAEPSGR